MGKWLLSRIIEILSVPLAEVSGKLNLLNQIILWLFRLRIWEQALGSDNYLNNDFNLIIIEI